MAVFHIVFLNSTLVQEAQSKYRLWPHRGFLQIERISISTIHGVLFSYLAPPAAAAQNVAPDRWKIPKNSIRMKLEFYSRIKVSPLPPAEILCRSQATFLTFFFFNRRGKEGTCWAITKIMIKGKRFHYPLYIFAYICNRFKYKNPPASAPTQTSTELNRIPIRLW